MTCISNTIKGNTNTVDSPRMLVVRSNRIRTMEEADSHRGRRLRMAGARLQDHRQHMDDRTLSFTLNFSYLSNTNALTVNAIFLGLAWCCVRTTYPKWLLRLLVQVGLRQHCLEPCTFVVDVHHAAHGPHIRPGPEIWAIQIVQVGRHRQRPWNGCPRRRRMFLFSYNPHASHIFMRSSSSQNQQSSATLARYSSTFLRCVALLVSQLSRRSGKSVLVRPSPSMNESNLRRVARESHANSFGSSWSLWIGHLYLRHWDVTVRVHALHPCRV